MKPGILPTFLLLFCIMTACDTATKQKRKTPEPNLTRQQSRAEQDRTLIRQHLDKQGIRAKETASGLHFYVSNEGSGKQPNLASRVKVRLDGSLLDGTKIEPSGEKVIPLNGAVIKGWQEGILNLKEGGKGRFYIPSGLAYGPRQIGDNIPAYSILIYDIELLEILN